MEIWDGYYKDGTLAGIDLVRSEPIPDGLYHLVCEVLVRHRDGSYLLMRRDPHKPNYGGFWEGTAGGSALKGENKEHCARRELFEETGIAADCFELIGRFISHDTIYYNYLCMTDWDKASVVLQRGETVDYRWTDEKEFIAFANSDKIIPGHRVRYHDFFVKMGYVLNP